MTKAECLKEVRKWWPEVVEIDCYEVGVECHKYRARALSANETLFFTHGASAQAAYSALVAEAKRRAWEKCGGRPGRVKALRGMR